MTNMLFVLINFLVNTLGIDAFNVNHTESNYAEVTCAEYGFVLIRKPEGTYFAQVGDADAILASCYGKTAELALKGMLQELNEHDENPAVYLQVYNDMKPYTKDISLMRVKNSQCIAVVNNKTYEFGHSAEIGWVCAKNGKYATGYSAHDAYFNLRIISDETQA